MHMRQTITCLSLDAVSNRQLSLSAFTRNIKGAHFAVGCDCSHHHLPKRSAVMNQEKYIGMDVHQATISVAVMDSSGKLIMECILETKAGHDSRVHRWATRNFIGNL